jgi:hypothetical protein
MNAALASHVRPERHRKAVHHRLDRLANHVRHIVGPDRVKAGVPAIEPHRVECVWKRVRVGIENPRASRRGGP